MNISLESPFLAVVVLVGLLGGLYTLLLWRHLCRLEGKIDALGQNCQRRHDENARLHVGRLEHEVEHQGLWEALHHHEHDFRGRVRR